jgi:hypothetical protein
LHDKISPLVSIVGLIFKEIVPFMIILCIVIFAFASAFWMIGRNQVEFDAIPAFDEDGSI